MHIILCGDNRSLMKIKENICTDKIMKLSVKCTFVWMTYAVFEENINQQGYKCAGGAEYGSLIMACYI